MIARCIINRHEIGEILFCSCLFATPHAGVPTTSSSQLPTSTGRYVLPYSLKVLGLVIALQLDIEWEGFVVTLQFHKGIWKKWE